MGMFYQVEITKKASKEIAKLPSSIARRVLKAIAALADDPRPAGVRKLQTVEATYRVRVGDYRIVYTINDRELVVLVVKVGNRRDVYN
jgi:mRNA interferase RelE/StbE